MSGSVLGASAPPSRASHSGWCGAFPLPCTLRHTHQTELQPTDTGARQRREVPQVAAGGRGAADCGGPNAGLRAEEAVSDLAQEAAAERRAGGRRAG